MHFNAFNVNGPQLRMNREEEETNQKMNKRGQGIRLRSRATRRVTTPKNSCRATTRRDGERHNGKGVKVHRHHHHQHHNNNTAKSQQPPHAESSSNLAIYPEILFYFYYYPTSSRVQHDDEYSYRRRQSQSEVGNWFYSSPDGRIHHIRTYLLQVVENGDFTIPIIPLSLHFLLQPPALDHYDDNT